MGTVRPGSESWCSTGHAHGLRPRVSSAAKAGITARPAGRHLEDLAHSCRQGHAQQVPVPGTPRGPAPVGPGSVRALSFVKLFDCPACLGGSLQGGDGVGGVRVLLKRSCPQLREGKWERESISVRHIGPHPCLRLSGSTTGVQVLSPSQLSASSVWGGRPPLGRRLAPGGSHGAAACVQTACLQSG